jgi:hypothetical protein
MRTTGTINMRTTLSKNVNIGTFRHIRENYEQTCLKKLEHAQNDRKSMVEYQEFPCTFKGEKIELLTLKCAHENKTLNLCIKKKQFIMAKEGIHKMEMPVKKLPRI